MSELGKLRQPRYQPRDIDHAAEDARMLMEQSPIISRLVGLDILSRQLYLAARSALENEIKHGWEVTNPELVMQTLVMAAQEKSTRQGFTMLELQQGLIGLALPVVDIFVRQEQDDQAEAAARAQATKETENAEHNGEGVPDQTEPILPGGDSQSATGVAAVVCGSGEGGDGHEESGQTPPEPSRDGTA